MGVMDYFKPVSTWTVQQVREFISSRDRGAYNLLDVRQPAEYESGHLPGAVLIPVGQLADRVGELDVSRPTIVYCAAGVRSRAGASILERAGFAEVHSMAGGINAWHGLMAKGFPEAGIPWFAAGRSVEELVALAWLLEEGTRIFYAAMAANVDWPDGAALFHDLAADEEHHKEMLTGIYRDISGSVNDIDFPALLGPVADERVMEGGMGLDDAMAWTAGKKPKDVLELSISLEVTSYDRYLAMGERVFSEKSIRLFRALAEQEKQHLESLTALFEGISSP